MKPAQPQVVRMIFSLAPGQTPGGFYGELKNQD